MATVTPTTATYAVKYAPTIWAKDTLDSRNAAIIIAPNVDRYDDLVTAYGDTIILPGFTSTKTATAKTPGTAIDFGAVTESYVTIALTRQMYDSVLIEDLIGTQSKYNLRSKYTMRFGNSLANALDIDLLGLTSLAAHSVATAVTTTGIAQTMITKAKYWLDLANAPQTERYMVVDPAGYEDLLNIDNFIRYDALGKNNIENGKVGRCFGFEVLLSSNVPSGSGIARAMFFQKSAIALAMQKDVTVKDEYSVDYLGTKLAAYNIYGYTVQRTDHMVYFAYGIS